MEQFDFSDFIAPEVQNKRRETALPPKVQEFDNLKYRRAKTQKGGKPEPVLQGGFHISKALFAALNLENYALRHFVNPKNPAAGVVIGVVTDENGKFMKKRENKQKGDSFKSDALEAALSVAGLISLDRVQENQFLDLIQISGPGKIAGVDVVAAYRVAKGEAKKAEEASSTAKPAAEAAPAPATPAPAAAPAPSAPVAETAAAPAGGQDDWS